MAEKNPALRNRPVIVHAHSVFEIVVAYTVAEFGLTHVWARAFRRVAEVVLVEIA